MATISKYQTSSGTNLYRVRYRTPDNRQTDKRGFRTKRDAELFAATVEVTKAKGEYVAPKLGRVTVNELAPDWLARKKQATAPSHYRTLETAWRVHVKPRWGKVSVADVDAREVDPRTYFQRIAEELRTSYEIGYYPSAAAKDDTFRKVVVRVKRPGLTVRSRTGYFSH